MTLTSGRGRYPRIQKIYELLPDLRISREETKLRFGYDAVYLSPTSQEKVVFSCVQCNRLVDRVRIRVKPDPRCNSCLRRKQDDGEPGVKAINDEETYKRFGYKGTDLNRGSIDKVVANCLRCKSLFEVYMRAVVKTGKCRGCLIREKCEQRFEERTNDGAASLRDAETQAQYGYLASTLSNKSDKHVVVSCTDCEKLFSRVRRNVVASPLCKQCSHKKIDFTGLVTKRRETMIARHGVPVIFGTVTRTSSSKKLAEDVFSGCNIQYEVWLKDGKILDIALPEIKLAVEYCGLHWHHENSPEPRLRAYHYDKMRQAEAEGYRLITIFSDEWVNRSVGVKNFLRSAAGLNEKRVGARKCDLVELDPTEAREFFETFHVQGSGSILKAWGLKHQGLTLAALSLGRHHRVNDQSIVVLNRFCVRSDINLPGGASKLLHRAAEWGKQQSFLKMVSWSDNRWSQGRVYEKLGFTLEESLGPDYSYVDVAKPRIRISKQSQKKSSTGCPPEITERAWALQHGLSRIWDCGHRRWILAL